MQFRSITFAGHAAVFIDADGYKIAIDPWLDNPNCPAVLKSIAKLDLIALTHGHSDHAGNALSLAKKTGAKIASSYELLMTLIGDGLPESQIIPMNKGGCVTHDGMTISLVHALHSNSYDSSKGTVYAGEACGVVIKDGTHSIYHAGDTALFSDMKIIREVHAPTVALLPIGDRFTMGPKDAARAAALIGAPVVIPIHHSTFPLLSGTPAAFEAACKELPLQVRTLAPGESFKL
jgi:L-ascorbate metabolism protein UlaG (beta-lactamase superfamily)